MMKNTTSDDMLRKSGVQRPLHAPSVGKLAQVHKSKRYHADYCSTGLRVSPRKEKVHRGVKMVWTHM